MNSLVINRKTNMMGFLIGGCENGWLEIRLLSGKLVYWKADRCQIKRG